MLLRMGLAPRPERHVRHSSIVIVMQIIVLASASSLDYEVPEPAIEAFQPKGLAVSIPDSEGIELFAFHANINKPLEGVEAGELSADVTHMSSDGRWTYRDAGRRLQVGDVIHYWLYVQRGGRGYQRLNQRHRIHALQSHEVDGNSASLDRPATIFIARPSDGGKVSVSSDDVQYRPPTPFRPPPPLYNSQPPPYDPYRPIDVPPGGATPDNLYGARPPPPPSYNHQYPPPPPPSGPVIHNHHVGFATESGNHHLATSNTNNGNNYSVDRYPAINAGGGSNYNSADRYPPTSNTQPVYRPEPVDGVDVTFSAVSPTASGSQVGQGAQEELGVGAENGGTQTLSSGDPFAVHAPTPPATVCELSATFVNGHRACKGQVVFEEDWRSLDLGKWSHEVKISGSPDYEFCVYTRHPDNSFVKHGLLHVKPTLTNDRYGADFIRKGKLELDDCTAGPINSDCCSREAMFSYILPPVITSRVNTKNSFSFKYGRVDIRTRLPRGDWIYPEVWLQPAREEYGPGLSSGRILLAMARGNRNLRGPSAEDLSGKQLMVGVLAGGRGGTAGARKKFFTRDNDVGLWTDQFHNYTLLWTPETLAFSVDGIEIGVARPEEFGGLLHGQEGDEVDPWSQDGSRIAPFDKEFYISLGLAVGGVHAFPDGCKSGRHEKPWKNTAAKAVLSFWNARDVWHSTWNGQQSELLVESVRVTALNT